MDILLRCAAAAMIAAILGLVIKKDNPEIALLLAIGAVVMLLTTVLPKTDELLEFIRELTEITGMPEGTISIALKAVAAALITGITAEVCRDAGQGALASACELVGALTALYMALPLLKIVLETMEKLL